MKNKKKISMDTKEGVEPRPTKYLLVLVFLLWIESFLFLFPKETKSNRPPCLDPTFLDSIVPHYLDFYPDGIFLFDDPVEQCYEWQKGNSKLVISVKSKGDLENSGKKVKSVHCVRWLKKGIIM
jgi:hypothetical protein